MTSGLGRRVQRIEQHVAGVGPGCPVCRSWGHAVYVFSDGAEDPPPICPSCGRDRPTTRLRRVYELPADFDAEEVSYAHTM